MEDMKKKKSFSDLSVQQQIKKLIAKSKEKNLIKKHTEAFKTNPVEKEKHKGKVDYFYN